MKLPVTRSDFLVFYVELEHVIIYTVVSFLCNTKMKLLSRNQLRVFGLSIIHHLTHLQG